MDDNARPHRALQVDEFLESEDIRHMDWPAKSPDPQSYRACLGRFGEDNCSSQPPSENHPGNENSVAERVGQISTRTDKLPYFQNGITLRGLYSCEPLKS
ncbi:transposable element Tcb2 transposase [Trichonephila clavipes]|nr:transposable element Tcb2 transposase [Trichonephila clavipes]